MRKIIVSNLISIDGFFAGPNGEIDWFMNVPGKDVMDYSISLMNSIDTMLFGRITYELMYSYWPNATPETEDPKIIEGMNNSNKIVFSTTMEKAEWKNTSLIKKNIDTEIEKLKQKSGKDMVIYGSGSIVSFLTRKGLIDEYRIFVVPVILGKGKPLFNDVNKMELYLADKRTFKSGMALLHYIK